MRVALAPILQPILVIAAHPDDSESWCAGTLAQSIAMGAAVHLLLVTSGDAGSADPQDTRAQVAARREAEARTAAAILGIITVQFLHYPDGAVENTLSLRAALVAAIRTVRPMVLFTHDPEQPYPPYLCHPDHRAVGRAALDAVSPLARDRLALDDHPVIARLAPHAVQSVWLFASTAADTAVDISATFDTKIAARLAHASQTTDPDALRQGWRERAARIGAPAGLPLAEAFVVLTP